MGLYIRCVNQTKLALNTPERTCCGNDPRLLFFILFYTQRKFFDFLELLLRIETLDQQHSVDLGQAVNQFFQVVGVVDEYHDLTFEHAGV